MQEMKLDQYSARKTNLIKAVMSDLWKNTYFPDNGCNSHVAYISAESMTETVDYPEGPRDYLQNNIAYGILAKHEYLTMPGCGSRKTTQISYVEPKMTPGNAPNLHLVRPWGTLVAKCSPT